MKKENVLFFISLILMIAASFTTVFAANYLYNSEDVSYDNSVSNLQSEDVQSAIDELYEHATDYTEIASRVTTLEGYFRSNTSSYFQNNGLHVGKVASGYGQIDVYKDGVSRGLIWATDNGLAISARNSSGTAHVGILNLRGSQIQFNGTDVSGLGTQSNVTPSATSVATGTYTDIATITLDAGTYLLYGSGNFASNATGYRELRLGTTSADNGAINYSFVSTANAVNGANTYLNVVSQYKFNSQTTLYLKAYHTKGSVASVTGRIYALKICG